MLPAIWPEIWVISSSGVSAKLVERCVSGWARVRRFDQPLELIAAGLDARPPLLLVAEVLNGSESWVIALQAMVERGCSPRRLLLAEPGVLDEVMQETFRAGEDHLVLWPADLADVRGALHYMIGTRPEAGLAQPEFLGEG